MEFEGYTILDMIKDNLFDLILFFKSADLPVEIFGVNIKWWDIVISLLLTGTIINFIVGSDEDIN